MASIPYNSGYQIFGPSPRTERFSVSLHMPVSIKDVALANHNTLALNTNVPPNYLFEGSIVILGNDGNWYWVGVTLPGAVVPAYMTGVAGSNPSRQMGVLVDSYDTNFNGTGNPVNASIYISGAFMSNWLQLPTGYSGGVAALWATGEPRINNILIEGHGLVTTQGYGPVYPREAAPV